MILDHPCNRVFLVITKLQAFRYLAEDTDTKFVVSIKCMLTIRELSGRGQSVRTRFSDVMEQKAQDGERLPYMREKKWGRVIMIASSAAKYPSAALIDYGATKAALISMSKSLARKYGRDGVLVNSVLPGLIHTAMWERAAKEIADANNTSVEDVINKNGRTVPVGRYGTPEEVSALVAFLCTDSASYINGTSIEVDGGSAAHI